MATTRTRRSPNRPSSELRQLPRIRSLHAKLINDMQRVVDLARKTAWAADDLAELVVEQIREEAFPLMLLPDGTDHELLRALVVSHAILFSVAGQVEMEIPHETGIKRKRRK